MRSTVLVLLLVCSTVAGADATGTGLTVRGDFTGNWTDPVANRQGVQIEIVDARRAVIAWFTYNTFGEPVWLFGTGEVDNLTIRAELVRFNGGTFPPTESDPDLIEQEVWGDVTLSFEDCNTGTMSWEPVLPGFEPGDTPIFRVTPIDGLRCGQAEEFEQTIGFSLDAGPGRWQGLFADFGEPQRELIEPETEWTDLPPPLSSRRGFKLAGTNRSDDLAMMMSAPLGGLLPSAEYIVEFEMTFATEVPAGCVGVGGSPGEGVTVKMGASPVEPAVVEQDGDFRFNIDKGNQTQAGPDAIVVGDMANSQDCEEAGFPGTWELKTVTSRGKDFRVRTDANGGLWVYALSDSAFESRTTFYITDFTVRLQPL
ncbi:MAG: hypothetical protein RQ847_12795 [Wenzhouxiangellaceae bacterium]|nr:hypothetical protein [Wenzhouxiangellaceae bacterium]